MKDIQSAVVQHVEPEDIYDFHDDGESLGRFKGPDVPGEKINFDGRAVDTVEQARKKRKRCGVCVPCLRKEPCGSCYNCINRSTSHQICKMRKCEELKKRRPAARKGAEVLNKDSSKIQTTEQLHSVKSCSESVSVDGPKTEQMETVSANHVEEGRLKQECDQGLLNKGCEGLGNRMLMEANNWLSNTPVPQDSSDKINWENTPITNHAAANNSHLEDAKNLVAFSAEAMSSYGIPASGTPSLVSMQLYEQFNYETNRESSVTEHKPPPCPGDLNTLQAALTMAKHGVKPPNCNCDGPECPDYLEWLENKIKTAVGDNQNSSHHTMSQVNTELVQKTYPKDHALSFENKMAKCPSGSLPFSQNALTIAKEKNISLQTAIAIEALTQLSSALPQPSKDFANGSSQHLLTSHDQLTHFPPSKANSGQTLPMACNELLHNQQSQLYTGENALPVQQPPRQPSWEQDKAPNYHERQYIPENISHGSSSALSKQVSTPQNSEYKNHWIADSEPPKSPSDPMTGLKQLLGHADDYVKSVFKSPEALPNRMKNVKSKQISVNSIKKEPPDYYKMSPDQQVSEPLYKNDFHQNTQAALQQHLHHRRNLFLDPNSGQPCAQEHPNWWVPNNPNTQASKSLEKVVKERKKRVQSPSQKQAEPKNKPPRKQAQIKKPKQKDAHTVFLPVNQIKIEEFRKVPNNENQVKEMLNDHSFSDMKQLGLAPQSLPHSIMPSSLENGNALNTQEMCTIRAGQANDLALCIPQASPAIKDICPSSSTEDTNSSTGQSDPINQQTSSGHGPVQNDLTAIDDKFEDLIRQFEAEFGDDFPLPSSEVPSQNGEGLPKASINHQTRLPFSSEVPVENARRPASLSNPALSNLSLQQELSQNFESLFSSRSPKQIKIESSGAITVVSTTCFYSEDSQHHDGTPTKSELPFNPSLRGFLESPMNYLSSPTKSLLDTPAKKAQAEFPTCNCVEQVNEKDEGPYYTHLGAGPTVISVRELMEERFGEKGPAVRIEKVIYTGKEGKSSRGCPIAKWVVRRQSDDEKILCLVRERAGHSCENAVIVILIMAWEGITRSLGDSLYRDLTDTITKYGNPTSRRCGLNDDRTCACQGKDPNTCGASFSFGCSWSMYFNGCKYARSKTPRKFRLVGDNPKEEECLRDNFQELATSVAPLYKQLAPQAYHNQVNNEDIAIDCRLGLKEGRPFSGVTACMDFCAHAHKDQHNLYNGCTVVCTLTKEDNRTVGKIAEDEQLHVLPLYKVSSTDEFGSEEGQADKIRKGGIQVLSSFPREVRKLSEPAKSCRQRQMEAKKAAAEKKKQLQKDKLTTPDKVKQEPATTPLCTPSPGAGQQVNPRIKVEPNNHYNTYKYNGNGVVESYSVLGSCRPSDPYSMNSVYSYHSFYAQPNLPSMNGFHSQFALPFGYYGFPSNHMVPSQFMNYGPTDTRANGWMSNRFEKKPEMQSLTDGTSHGYGNELSEQNYMRSSEMSHQYNIHDPTSQKSASIPHRTTPVPMDATSYPQSLCFNRPIKKEPASDLLHVDAFQRASSFHSHSPGVNRSLQNNDQPIPYKPNGALASSERMNAEGPCSMLMSNEKVNLVNGLEKREYFGANANGMGLKSIHGKDKHWSAYGMDSQTSQRDTSTQGKIWSSCKLSDSPAVLPSSASMQEKNWNAGQNMKETVLYQEKLWNSIASGDRRSITPNAGLQDKAWNMFANPSVNSLKADDSQSVWDPYSLDDSSDASEKHVKEEDDEEIWSDSEHNFLDDNIGGVAVAPAHGSILIECARRELHATTPVKKPNRCHPTRISLVFYQHKNLNQPNHGLALWEAKMKMLAERARLKQEEAARLGIKTEDKNLGKKRKWGGGSATTDTPPIDKIDIIPTRQATTVLTNSATAASSYAYTKVTGPYSRWI